MTITITDEQWETINKKIMALPGMVSVDADFMSEDNDDGTTYIKFMSDHGVHDDANGKVLSAHLLREGCEIESSRFRSMTVRNADLVRLFL